MTFQPRPPSVFKDLVETFRKPTLRKLKERQLDDHERALLKAQEDAALAAANVTIYTASAQFHEGRIAALRQELDQQVAARPQFQGLFQESSQ